MKQRMVLSIVAILVLLASVLGISNRVSAYNWPSPYFKWYTRMVPFNTSSLPSNWISQVNTAGSTWNGSGALFVFYADSSSNNTWDTYNYGAISKLAVTGIYGPDNPPDQITRNTTVFNTYNSFNIGSDYDVQTVALHEFGHWLSLDDVGTWYTWLWDHNKVMYCEYTGIKHSLDQDDINGIIAIYGQ